MTVGDRLTGYYQCADGEEPEWVEYENEAIAEARQAEYLEAQKYQAALEAPATLNDVQDAVCELGDLAASNEVSVSDLMDAIIELGNLVAELVEVNNG